jgi:hypothetical protein
VEFRALPIDPDAGLPQRFSVTVGGTAYNAIVYASITTRREDPTTHVYDLSSPVGVTAPETPRGYLVLRMERAATGDVVLLRKLIPESGLVQEAAELAVVARRIAIARGNLNGPGKLGSEIVVGVARRWE